MRVCPQCERQYGEEVEFCAHDGARLRAMDEETEDPMIGRVIEGRWRVEEKVGEGGMGAIYVATQQRVGRKVAVKTLRAALSDNQEFVDRFMQEARVTTDISHPHCVTIHDFGRTDNGLLFLVMELLEGEPLSERMNSSTIGVKEALAVGLQVASALAAAHDRNIIHRDLKPENIYLLDISDGSTFVKVLDFGISKDLDNDDNMTKTGQLFGTPKYMSPEQCRGETLDGRSDLYSLGCILYEMMTGRAPFEGEKSMNILVSHVQDEVESIEEATDRQIPSSVQHLVMSLLKKEPADRPETATEVRRSIERLQAKLEGWDESSYGGERDEAIGSGATAAVDWGDDVSAGMGSARGPTGRSSGSGANEESRGGGDDEAMRSAVPGGPTRDSAEEEDNGGTRTLLVVVLLGAALLFGGAMLAGAYVLYSNVGGDGALTSVFGGGENSEGETSGDEESEGASPDGERADKDNDDEKTGSDAEDAADEETEVAAGDADAGEGAGENVDTGPEGEKLAQNDPDEGEEPTESGGVTETGGSGNSGGSSGGAAGSGATTGAATSGSGSGGSSSGASGGSGSGSGGTGESQPVTTSSGGSTADDTKEEPKEPKVQPGEFVRRTSLSATGAACVKSDVRRKLSAAEGALGRCFQSVAESQPGLSGEVMMDWNILTDGKALEPSVIKSSLNDGTVESCVERAIGRVRFRPPSGGRCYTRVTFQFRAP